MFDVTPVVGILSVVLNLTAFYYAVLFFESSRWKTVGSRWEHIAPKTRFAIYVPAHNEAMVIEDIISDLANQNYPNELYDAFIIDDNSTDGTPEVVLKCSMRYPNIHLIKKNHFRNGKPAALNHALNSLGMDQNLFAYDAVAVFDADNTVEKDWLKKVDAAYQNGATIVQTNVATKNQNESLLTKLIYYEYLAFGRMWQVGKKGMKWCNALAGTGMSMKSNLLSRNGMFGSGNLTEDLEFTVRMFKKGHRVEYLHYAHVYDEKPSRMRPMLNQRTRWTIGHLQTLKSHFKLSSVEKWDANFYSIAILLPLAVILSWGLTLGSWLGLITFQGQPSSLWVFSSFSFMLMIVFTVWDEGDKNIIFHLPLLHIFLQHWIPVVLMGLFRFWRNGGNLTWVKTPHGYSRKENGHGSSGRSTLNFFEIFLAFTAILISMFLFASGTSLTFVGA